MTDPILALEGALGSFSVAALHEDRVWAEQLEGRDALERGLGLVDAVLARAGLSAEELAGIAVGSGPGGFTGLRIAISFAKSLALGLGRPLAGVSSFDILDRAAGAELIFPRLTFVWGRTGIACIRRSDAQASRVACGPIESTLARLVQNDAALTVVGATEDVCGAVLERGTSVHFIPSSGEIPAVTLAQVARTRAAASSVHAIAPDYGEIPAAKSIAREAPLE